MEWLVWHCPGSLGRWRCPCPWDLPHPMLLRFCPAVPVSLPRRGISPCRGTPGGNGVGKTRALGLFRLSDCSDRADTGPSVPPTPRSPTLTRAGASHGVALAHPLPMDVNLCCAPAQHHHCVLVPESSSLFPPSRAASPQLCLTLLPRSQASQLAWRPGCRSQGISSNTGFSPLFPAPAQPPVLPPWLLLGNATFPWFRPSDGCCPGVPGASCSSPTPQALPSPIPILALPAGRHSLPAGSCKGKQPPFS